MKTIKDFKMKCADVPQRDEVIRILEENGYKDSFIFSDLNIFLCKNGILELKSIKSMSFFQELTYSEFMQLYSDPQIDELMELKEWSKSNLHNPIDTILLENKIKEIIERRKK